jgi:hypothetical protein
MRSTTVSAVRQARARLAAVKRWHPDDRAAIQAAKDRLLVANLQALLAVAERDGKT